MCAAPALVGHTGVVTEHIDPRVVRTRARVLSIVRDILASDGPMAVTHSSVARRAGVGRQTVYNHWPTREALVVEATLEGYEGGYPETVDSVAEAIRQWLSSLGGAMSDHARIAALAGVISFAFHDEDSCRSLEELSRDRLDAFNQVLLPFGVRCSGDDYARIVGPVFYQLLVARQPVTSALIEATANSIEAVLDPQGSD